MIRQILGGMLGTLALFACGCAGEEALTPLEGPLRGQLAVDIRDQADVEIRGEGPALDVDVTVKLSKGFGLVKDGAALMAPGRVEAFPEAGMTLYTARFEAPAIEGGSGPCGAQPVSLALSLHMREGTRASGSLAAYCGAGTYSGEPARILRLSGDLKR
jgi:hypothetical protein